MTGEDLYQMLGLEKTASQAEIKKAYYKLALQWHPDRNPAPEATAKFQALQRVYDVLSDPQKRQVYDRTGSLQDCEDLVQGDNFQELYEAFREALKVTEDDIDSFSVTYRGSAEERSDLLRFYGQFGGNMARVFDWLMLSRPELDSHRFRDTIEAAIAAGEVKRLKPYKAWAAKVASTPPPSSDPLAPPPKKKKGKGAAGSSGDELALVAAIKNKQSAYNGMLAALEAKYAGGSSKGKVKGKGKQQPGAAAAAPGSSSGGKRKRGKAAAAAASGSSEGGSSAGSNGEDSDREGCEEADQGQEPTEEEFAAARAKLLARTAGAAAAAVPKGKAGKQATAGAGKGKAAAAAPPKKQRKQKA